MSQSCNQGGKRTYHICLSSANEVIFRSNEDYYRAFNCYALALYKTGSMSLADAFMSNHFHVVVQTDNPSKFIQSFRGSYSQYFNRKYHRNDKQQYYRDDKQEFHRSTRLGERKCFCIEIKGLYHHLAAISYVVRNPVHHGLVATPFGYEHSSANVIFKRDLGKDFPGNPLPHKSHYKHISKNVKSPAHFQMSENGVYFRESVTDLQKVEYMYMSPRAFDYYMNRRTSEEWLKEQEKDGSGIQPITLELIEEGFIKNSDIKSYEMELKILNRMKSNEYGKGNYSKISDIELCTFIDNQMLQRFGKLSVYHLSGKEKIQIAAYLHKLFHPSEKQVARCLVL